MVSCITSHLMLHCSNCSNWMLPRPINVPTTRPTLCMAYHAAGYNHLVVATASQCHVYSTTNWNTPHIFDLKDPPQLILQCERCFLLSDPSAGLQLFTYEGRQICNPKAQGLKSDFLSSNMLSLSNDTLAVMEGPGSSSIRFLDTAQGRQMGDAYVHGLEVKQIGLSQVRCGGDVVCPTW